MSEFELKMLDREQWKSFLDAYIKDYFSKNDLYDKNEHIVNRENIMEYIDNIWMNDVLSDMYTGEWEHVEGAGRCEISLYDYFSDELENILIGKFYEINKKEFGETLEDFADYFLSEHTYLLADYIYNLLNEYTAEHVKSILKSTYGQE